MFDHILAPLDGSSLAECALPHAAAVAAAFNAKLTVLQVLSRMATAGAFVDPLAWQMDRVETSKYLDEVRRRLRQCGFEAEPVILDGQPASSIIEYARHQSVSLIVLSSHGRSGLSIWNVSGVVQKIVQRAGLPVLIVRANQPICPDLNGLRYRTILAPLDSSQRAECVLPIAARLARYFQARLLAVHAVARPEMPRRTAPSAEDLELADRLTGRNTAEAAHYLDQIQKRLNDADLEVETRLLVHSSGAAAALHDLVDRERVDLVVLSAHGYSGETRWPYGSVVDKFISYGSSSLLIYQDLSPYEMGRSASVEPRSLDIPRP